MVRFWLSRAKPAASPCKYSTANSRSPSLSPSAPYSFKSCRRDLRSRPLILFRTDPPSVARHCKAASCSASVTRQCSGTVGHGIGGSEKHRIRGMRVSARDRPPLMANESGNRRLAIAEIYGDGGETVPQYMRRDIGGQAAELCNSKPEFLE